MNFQDACSILVPPVAPAYYAGRQPGFGRIKPFDLFTLTAAIPGHGVHSTVSAQTLLDLGFRLPPKPANNNESKS